MKFFRFFFNLLLVGAACVLVWMCYECIQIPIRFKDEVKTRDAVVVDRLKDIRALQVIYQKENEVYAASWNELIRFIEKDSLSICRKIGELTDQQRAKGLNDKKAWEYLCNPKKYAKEIEETGLSIETFSRDTIKVSALRTFLEENPSEKYIADVKWYKEQMNNAVTLEQKDAFYEAYCPMVAQEWLSKIQFVPYAEQDTFFLNVAQIEQKGGYMVPVFEAKVPWRTYLKGENIGESELHEKIVKRLELTGMTSEKAIEAIEKDESSVEPIFFPGLQVGDVNKPNNNAGNWE